MSARSTDPVADADDEPPPSRPRGVHGVEAPNVLAADRRRDGDPTPVALDELSDLLAAVLACEGAPAAAEASLTLVDESQIAELKAEHLGGTGDATDVLSFPIDGTEPDAEIVGDVVLCPSVAAAQAPAHAGALDDELALLVVHGGLHLAGWDHDSATERAAMWARERQLLAELHRLPFADPWSESA